jgi:hypothetical protein
VHKPKHSSPNISTDAGTNSSVNPVSWNAQFPIRDNIDPDSCVTELSDTQPAKQPSPRTLIDAGITISINPVNEEISLGFHSRCAVK